MNNKENNVNVCVVIPVYNEEENMAPLCAQLAAALAPMGQAQALLVDDGSRDGTWAAIEAATREIPCIKGLKSPANEGQSSAMLRGLQAAAQDADILVTMDGDLQNDPADIPALVAAMGDADCVCGYRANRRDTWSRRIASRGANRIRNWVTHDGMRDTGCSLKAFKACCVEDLPPVDGVHRFMPAWFQLHERSVVEQAVNHRPRVAGTSKYTNLKRLPRTILDLFGFWWYRRRFLPQKGVAQACPPSA